MAAASSLTSKSLPKRLRSDDANIFLVGKCEKEIFGAKLPSMKQVLQVLFYNIRVEHNNLKESCRLAINSTLPFWQKARIPTRTENNCTQKLEKLYNEWRILQKTCNSQYEKHRLKENEFREKIEDSVFDIAAFDALETMKIQEDKDFLIQQRQKGRPGSMVGIDKKFSQKEVRKLERLEKANNPKRKHMQDMSDSTKGN